MPELQPFNPLQKVNGYSLSSAPDGLYHEVSVQFRHATGRKGRHNTAHKWMLPSMTRYSQAFRPRSGQGVASGTRIRDRKIPADFRANFLATVPLMLLVKRSRRM
ncbi:hypothetical protein PoB_002922600 [Plakobranchus ocellatus]|uniref:Uncharacterized protein n=1 Tax=Plakobranchus ocellatus TaxID=259542 RepID=A0AAV4A3E2_9GAST|nr:hypothetical protein PoB_002922600 [Plakobranchus ocellatus]